MPSIGHENITLPNSTQSVQQLLLIGVCAFSFVLVGVAQGDAEVAWSPQRSNSSQPTKTKEAIPTPRSLPQSPEARPLSAKPTTISVAQPIATPLAGRIETSSLGETQTSELPTALLIRNPHTDNGEPEYALADQFGRVQRFVEPTGTVNLEAHIGQQVRVRHDTGKTLLASQLELPGGMPAIAQQNHPFAEHQPVVIEPANIEPANAVVTTQYQDEKSVLPEPIVLEEVIGEPMGAPYPNGSAPLPPGASLPPIEGPANFEPRRSIPAPYPSTGPTSPGHDPNCPHCRAKAAAANKVISAGPAITGPAITGSGITMTPDGTSCPTCNSGNLCNQCATRTGRSGHSRPSVYFEAELLLLRMFSTTGDVSNDSFETGSRWSAGVQTGANSSWSLRYLEYDNGNFDGFRDLSLETIDLEYGRQFPVGCNWNGMATLGLRYADLGYQSNFFNNNRGYGDSFGPVVGFQLRGPGRGNFYPLLGLRYSVQFADDSNGTFSLTETAAGIEYRRPTRRGSTLYGRAAAETLHIGGTEDIGLAGVGFSLGIVR